MENKEVVEAVKKGNAKIPEGYIALSSETVEGVEDLMGDIKGVLDEDDSEKTDEEKEADAMLAGVFESIKKLVQS